MFLASNNLLPFFALASLARAARRTPSVRYADTAILSTIATVPINVLAAEGKSHVMLPTSSTGSFGSPAAHNGPYRAQFCSARNSQCCVA